MDPSKCHKDNTRSSLLRHLYTSSCLVLQHMDLDGDGYITQEELQEALAGDIPDAQQLQDAVREALRDADKDNDGRIDYMVGFQTMCWIKQHPT